MKTVKRILAVILLAVILWAVGYLVFTGRRLPSVFTEEVAEQTIEFFEGSVTNEETSEAETEKTYGS